MILKEEEEELQTISGSRHPTMDRPESAKYGRGSVCCSR